MRVKLMLFIYISFIATGFLSCSDKEVVIESSPLKLLLTTSLQGQTDVYKHTKASLFLIKILTLIYGFLVLAILFLLEQMIIVTD